METIKKVKERPVLFSTPMVQAIMEGRKTVTRRVIKTQPDNECYFEMRLENGILTIDYNQGDENPKVKCPYGIVNDVLWVRETWRKYHPVDTDGYTDFSKTIIEFAADNPEPVRMVDADGAGVETKNGSEKFIPWKPSIFMPREACRLKLEIVSIGVERLHDITEEDAIKEGVEENICADKDACPSSLCKTECSGKGEYYRYPVGFDAEPCYSARESFETLWQSINGEESWNANPWVWRIEFKKL
jgi:hypothetical protein